MMLVVSTNILKTVRNPIVFTLLNGKLSEKMSTLQS